MTIEVALEHLPKETFDKYARIECRWFGDILRQAMGITGKCTAFILGKYGSGYSIACMQDNGEYFVDSFDYYKIIEVLKGKHLTVTMDVHTLD